MFVSSFPPPPPPPTLTRPPPVITLAHALHVNLQKAQRVGEAAATQAGAELQKKQQQMLKAAQEQAKQQTGKRKF